MVVWKSSEPAIPVSTEPIHAKIFEAMRRTVAQNPNHVAFITAENAARVTKTQDLMDLAQRVAVFLNKKGFGLGDVATCYLPNTVQHVAFILATMTCGGAYATTNLNFTSGEISERLRDNKSIMILTDEEHLPIVLDARQNTNLKYLMCYRTTNRPLPEGVLDFRETYRESTDISRIAFVFSPTQTVYMPYSSGTTGKAKGVLLTHTNIGTTLEIVAWHGRKWNEALGDDSSCQLVQQPLYHVSGFLVTFQGIMNGITGIQMRTFDPILFLKLVQSYKLKWISASPVLLRFLATHPAAMRFELSSLKAVFCSSAPLGKYLGDAFVRRFSNARILQGYGMTEMGTMSHCPSVDLRSEEFLTCGQVCSNFECKIVDATGKELGADVAGEIVVRSPTVMLGYNNNRQATGKAIRDGWLHTGDYGRMDSKGRLHVIDRLAEIIQLGTIKVAPAELEDILMSHTLIAEAAVIGAPHWLYGTAPHAFVVRVQPSSLPDARELSPGSASNQLTTNDVCTFVGERFGGGQVLFGVEFVDKLPKNATGKVLKGDLRLAKESSSKNSSSCQIL